MADALTCVYSKLLSFLEKGIADKKSIDNIKKIDTSEMEFIRYVLLDQIKIKENVCYSNYTINLTDKSIKCNSDSESNITHIDIQNYNSMLIVNIMEITNLLQYVTENKLANKKYVFLPIIFSNNNEIKYPFHYSALIINLFNNKIYLFDPNGKNTYFNNFFVDYYVNYSDENYEDKLKNSSKYKIDTQYFMELFFKQYFDDFNKISNIKFQFVKCSLWNENNVSLNRKFQNSFIGTGHCVITTHLFGHYLITSQDDIDYVIKLFGDINDHDLLNLINEYYIGVTNILKYIE